MMISQGPTHNLGQTPARTSFCLPGNRFLPSLLHLTGPKPHAPTPQTLLGMTHAPAPQCGGHTSAYLMGLRDRRQANNTARSGQETGKNDQPTRVKLATTHFWTAAGRPQHLVCGRTSPEMACTCKPCAAVLRFPSKRLWRQLTKRNAHHQ